MPSLASKLRKDLENAVKQARRAAETGAGKALDLLAVGHHEPWGSLKPEQRRLRNRLRAHGVQLGDARDDKRGTQSITRLTGEVAYEQAAEAFAEPLPVKTLHQIGYAFTADAQITQDVSRLH